MSYQVIARKYRPQIFDDVVGQKLITDTLKNAVLHNRIAHGYIFSGARGVGKTTTARILAKAINCAQGPTVTPCGVCESCREIAAGNCVDVLEIDAASNRGIDEIRELRDRVRYLPARDRYKVFIIDEAHMLTTEAFNALLKTLEEPPPRSVFILATTEPHKLPTTIQSRCQHFSFRLLDYAEIHSRLEQVAAAEGVEADSGSLGAIAQAAEGSLRDALSLLDQVIAACGDKLSEERVRQLLGVVPSRFLREIVEAIDAGDARRVLQQMDALTREGYELSAFCAEFTRYVRDLMVARTCGERSSLLQVPDDQRPGLADLARRLSEEDLARFFQILLRTQNELRYSLQPRFHLELGMMKLVHARRLASLETLLGELRGAVPKTSGGSGAPPGRRPAASAEASQASSAGRAEGVSVPASAAACRAGAAVLGAAAPAREAVRPVVGPAEAPVPAPIDDSRFASIKSLIFSQSKLLASCLDPVVGWRFENGEAHFVYSRKDSWAAELLKTRERQEALRAACRQVLGQPVRVCVTLREEEAETARAGGDARERAERDPRVAAFQKKFECSVLDVKDLSRE